MRTGSTNKTHQLIPSCAAGPMLSDDYPPQYPGMLRNARRVLRQVIESIRDDNVTMLEFPQQYSLDLPLGCQCRSHTPPSQLQPCQTAATAS